MIRFWTSRKGMAEIVGAALLILFLAIQIMPAVKNVSINSDKLIAAVDAKIKGQLTTGNNYSIPVHSIPVHSTDFILMEDTQNDFASGTLTDTIATTNGSLILSQLPYLSLQYNDSNWSSAYDYGTYGVGPWGSQTIGWPDNNAHWIWGSNDYSGLLYCFRKTFTLSASGNVTFYITADNAFALYVDGALILTGMNWRKTYSKTLSLTSGNHLVTVIAGNDPAVSSSAGLLVSVKQESTGNFILRSDNTWKTQLLRNSPYEFFAYVINTLERTYTFVRNSKAYDLSGNVCNPNIPRKENGIIDKGFMFENGTTNYLSHIFISQSNLLKFASICDYTGSGTVTIDTTQTSPISGMPVVKHVATGDDSYYWADDSGEYPFKFASPYKMPVSGGEYVTFSVWAKGEKGGEKLELCIFDYAGTTSSYYFRVRKSQEFTLSTQWQRYSITTQVATDAKCAWVRIDNNYAGQTIYWSAPQFEKSNYPTTFITDTRSNEVLFIDLSQGSFQTDISRGALSFWIKPLHTFAVDNSLYTRHQFIGIGGTRFISSDVDNRSINVWYDATDGGLLASVGTGTGTVTVRYNVTLTADTWYHIGVVWSAGSSLLLYLNGSLVASAPLPAVVSATNLKYNKIFIGGTSLNRFAADAIIDEVAFYWDSSLDAVSYHMSSACSDGFYVDTLEYFTGFNSSGIFKIDGNNIAYNKPYTKNLTPNAKYPDTSNAEFTDGQENGRGFTDVKSFGYSYIELGTTNGGIGSVEITVDLGAEKWINRATLISGDGWLNHRYEADMLEILTSTDGTNFTSKGTAGTLNNPTKYLTVSFTPTKARYVKFKITKDLAPAGQPGDWLFIMEGYVYECNALSGSRVSPVYDISQVKTAGDSSISWTATTPPGTSVTIESNLSLDGGNTWLGWKQCTNGGQIPDITPGTDLSNARLQIREKLTTNDVTVTPSLDSLTINITAQ